MGGDEYEKFGLPINQPIVPHISTLQRDFKTYGESRDYWYLFEDMRWLLKSLIKEQLYDNDEESYEIEWLFLRENQRRIFIAEPYLLENFERDFNNQMTQISGTHSEPVKNLCWKQMPQYLILPLLIGLHWCCLRIEMHYDTHLIDILYDDPFGEENFDREIREKLLEVMREPLLQLMRSNETHLAEAESDISDFKIEIHLKRLDQQKLSPEDCDGGVIIFENIKDYLKTDVTNVQFSEEASEKHYTIKSSTNEDHDELMIRIRAEHLIRFRLSRKPEGVWNFCGLVEAIHSKTDKEQFQFLLKKWDLWGQTQRIEVFEVLSKNRFLKNQCYKNLSYLQDEQTRAYEIIKNRMKLPRAVRTLAKLSLDENQKVSSCAFRYYQSMINKFDLNHFFRKWVCSDEKESVRHYEPLLLLMSFSYGQFFQESQLMEKFSEDFSDLFEKILTVTTQLSTVISKQRNVFQMFDQLLAEKHRREQVQYESALKEYYETPAWYRWLKIFPRKKQVNVGLLKHQADICSWSDSEVAYRFKLESEDLGAKNKLTAALSGIYEAASLYEDNPRFSIDTVKKIITSTKSGGLYVQGLYLLFLWHAVENEHEVLSNALSKMHNLSESILAILVILERSAELYYQLFCSIDDDGDHARGLKIMLTVIIASHKSGAVYLKQILKKENDFAIILTVWKCLYELGSKAIPVLVSILLDKEVDILPKVLVLSIFTLSHSDHYIFALQSIVKKHEIESWLRLAIGSICAQRTQLLNNRNIMLILRDCTDCLLENGFYYLNIGDIHTSRWIVSELLAIDSMNIEALRLGGYVFTEVGAWAHVDWIEKNIELYDVKEGLFLFRNERHRRRAFYLQKHGNSRGAYAHIHAITDEHLKEDSMKRMVCVEPIFDESDVGKMHEWLGFLHQANAHIAMGNYIQAAQLYRESIENYEKQVGGNDERILDLVKRLMRVYHLSGQYERAWETLDKLVDLHSRHMQELKEEGLNKTDDTDFFNIYRNNIASSLVEEYLFEADLWRRVDILRMLKNLWQQSIIPGIKRVIVAVIGLLTDKSAFSTEQAELETLYSLMTEIVDYEQLSDFRMMVREIADKLNYDYALGIPSEVIQKVSPSLAAQAMKRAKESARDVQESLKKRAEEAGESASMKKRLMVIKAQEIVGEVADFLEKRSQIGLAQVSIGFGLFKMNIFKIGDLLSPVVACFQAGSEPLDDLTDFMLPWLQTESFLLLGHYYMSIDRPDVAYLMYMRLDNDLINRDFLIARACDLQAISEDGKLNINMIEEAIKHYKLCDPIHLPMAKKRVDLLRARLIYDSVKTEHYRHSEALARDEAMSLENIYYRCVKHQEDLYDDEEKGNLLTGLLQILTQRDIPVGIRTRELELCVEIIQSKITMKNGGKIVSALLDLVCHGNLSLEHYKLLLDLSWHEKFLSDKFSLWVEIFARTNREFQQQIKQDPDMELLIQEVSCRTAPDIVERLRMHLEQYGQFNAAEENLFIERLMLILDERALTIAKQQIILVMLNDFLFEKAGNLIEDHVEHLTRIILKIYVDWHEKFKKLTISLLDKLQKSQYFNKVLVNKFGLDVELFSDVSSKVTSASEDKERDRSVRARVARYTIKQSEPVMGALLLRLHELLDGVRCAREFFDEQKTKLNEKLPGSSDADSEEIPLELSDLFELEEIVVTSSINSMMRFKELVLGLSGPADQLCDVLTNLKNLFLSENISFVLRDAILKVMLDQKTVRRVSHELSGFYIQAIISMLSGGVEEAQSCERRVSLYQYRCVFDFILRQLERGNEVNNTIALSLGQLLLERNIFITPEARIKIRGVAGYNKASIERWCEKMEQHQAEVDQEIKPFIEIWDFKTLLGNVLQSDQDEVVLKKIVAIFQADYKNSSYALLKELAGTKQLTRIVKLGKRLLGRSTELLSSREYLEQVQETLQQIIDSEVTAHKIALKDLIMPENEKQTDVNFEAGGSSQDDGELYELFELEIHIQKACCGQESSIAVIRAFREKYKNCQALSLKLLQEFAHTDLGLFWHHGLSPRRQYLTELLRIIDYLIYQKRKSLVTEETLEATGVSIGSGPGGNPAAFFAQRASFVPEGILPTLRRTDVNSSYYSFPRQTYGNAARDDRWYTDDDINLLFNDYFDGNEKVKVLSAMLGTNFLRGSKMGNDLRENLIQFKEQRVHDFILIPINIGNYHWVLLYLIYPCDGELSIYYFDSLAEPIHRDTVAVLEEIYGKEVEIIPVIDKPIQKGGDNCGPWITVAACHIVDSEAVPDSNFDIESAREAQMVILAERRAQSQKLIC